MNSTELQHYGILGMKWGVRRRSKRAPEKPVKVSSDHAKAVSLKRKKVSEMSNDELQTLTRRMNLEAQYANLTVTKKSKGRQFAEAYLSKFGKKVADHYTDEAFKRVMSKAAERAARGA